MPNNLPIVPEYLSVKQAAQLVGICESILLRYINGNRLPSYEPRGVRRLLVKRSEVLELIVPKNKSGEKQ